MKRMILSCMILPLFCFSCILPKGSVGYGQAVRTADGPGPAKTAVPLADRYAIPAFYQQKNESSAASIEINATVDVPSCNTMPILRVTPGYFDKGLITSVVHSLINSHESQVNAPRMMRFQHEIEQELATLQDDTSFIPAIDILESNYTFCVLNEQLSSRAANTFASNSYLHFRDDSISPSFDSFELDSALAVDSRTVPSKTTLTISPRQACELVQEFLIASNISNEVAVSGVYLSSDTNDEDIEYCYRVLCQRIIDGIAVVPLIGISNLGVAGKEWTYEALTVKVNNTGIFSVTWNAPIQIEEVVVEDVPLLSFSKVMDCFENVVLEKVSSWDQLQDHTKYTLSIKSISLSLQRIDDGTGIGGWLIPAWNFYGVSNCTQTINGTDYFETRIPVFQPIVSISAFDGSEIDLTKRPDLDLITG